MAKKVPAGKGKNPKLGLLESPAKLPVSSFESSNIPLGGMMPHAMWFQKGLKHGFEHSASPMPWFDPGRWASSVISGGLQECCRRTPDLGLERMSIRQFVKAETGSVPLSYRVLQRTSDC